MLDLNKTRGTIANAVAPITGTASGALGSGLLVQYLPQPTHLVYLVLLGVFVVQAAGVLLMPETSSPAPGALASLRPQFSVPGPVRRPMLFAVPALVAIWAVASLYGSLGPALIKLVSGSGSIVLGGLPLFVLAGSGAVTVLLLQRRSARQLMLIGAGTLLAGTALTLVAVDLRSTVAFFVGAAIAGIGFGGAFQGAIRSVVPLTAPHQRAGVLSVVYVVSYLALGLPAVIAGVLLVHEGNLVATAVQFGVVVMVLAALALAGALRPDVQADPAPPERDEVIPAQSSDTIWSSRAARSNGGSAEIHSVRIAK